MRVVLDEAERNPEFEAALAAALAAPSARQKEPKGSGEPKALQSRPEEGKRGKNRRAPATLDPVQVIGVGEPALRSELQKLTVEQLKDIVAEFGMDPGRLAIKWTTPERLVERIVEVSLARAHKGDAFRRPAAETTMPAASAPSGGDGNSEKR
jgi:hypothetical protein